MGKAGSYSQKWAPDGKQFLSFRCGIKRTSFQTEPILLNLITRYLPIMETEVIDVYNLSDVSHLSVARCSDFSEAAAVCLDYHEHEANKVLLVEGDLQGQFELSWREVTQRMRDSRSDMEYTVESGAYCLAMLVIEKLTGLRVTKQSQKRSGFDYWLGDREKFGVQGQARLEVSGILNGSRGQINQRLKEKVEQTKKSDNLNLPAYVVIVEFSIPMMKIRKR